MERQTVRARAQAAGERWGEGMRGISVLLSRHVQAHPIKKYQEIQTVSNGPSGSQVNQTYTYLDSACTSRCTCQALPLMTALICTSLFCSSVLDSMCSGIVKDVHICAPRLIVTYRHLIEWMIMDGACSSVTHCYSALIWLYLVVPTTPCPDMSRYVQRSLSVASSLANC